MIGTYLGGYLLLLRNQIDQSTSQLIAHSTEYPIALPSLEFIDERLKKFVRLHHLDLLRACSYQKSKLNTQILIQQFSKQLSKFHLTTKQVEMVTNTFSSDDPLFSL